MRLLLDAHAYLSAVFDRLQLSVKARRLFQDPNNLLLLSVGSIWEIAIKVSIGKREMRGSFESFIPAELQANRVTQLNIDFRHVARLASLPFHHRDPIDRLTIARALEESLAVVSADPAFDKYKIKRRW